MRKGGVLKLFLQVSLTFPQPLMENVFWKTHHVVLHHSKEKHTLSAPVIKCQFAHGDAELHPDAVTGQPADLRFCCRAAFDSRALTEP